MKKTGNTLFFILSVLSFWLSGVLSSLDETSGDDSYSVLSTCEDAHIDYAVIPDSIGDAVVRLTKNGRNKAKNRRYTPCFGTDKFIGAISDISTETFYKIFEASSFDDVKSPQEMVIAFSQRKISYNTRASVNKILLI